MKKGVQKPYVVKGMGEQGIIGSSWTNVELSSLEAMIGLKFRISIEIM